MLLSAILVKLLIFLGLGAGAAVYANLLLPTSSIVHSRAATTTATTITCSRRQSTAIVVAQQTLSPAAMTAAEVAEAAKKKKKRRDVFAILASAFSAAAIMYPVDLVRALQMANAGSSLSTGQLLSNFKAAHGIKGFFTQGLAPELARSTWMRAVKFSLFPAVHLYMSGVSVEQGTALTKTIAAFVGSIPEVISIMPLEIAKITLQLDTKNVFKNNMFSAMMSVAKSRGVAGFSIGYWGVQLRQALWSAGYFSSINFFDKQVDQAIRWATKGKLNAKSNKSVQGFSQLFSGFLAGVFGGLLNTPFDTIRSTIQKRMLTNAASNLQTSFVGVGTEILAAKGFSGLYAGFGFKAFHLGGGGALMAFFIPFFKNFIESLEQQKLD